MNERPRSTHDHVLQVNMKCFAKSEPFLQGTYMLVILLAISNAVCLEDSHPS